MADAVVKTIDTSTTHGAIQTGSTSHGAVNVARTSGPVSSQSEATHGSRTDEEQSTKGARTDQTAMHRGVEITVRLAIYQPRLGGGPLLSC